ncbi:MAG: formate dehydrogenase accessory sulfurtransferase FdhD [Caldilineaceae bacterium]|nr:formate dehydrogenase accessory sulfurtransferase FdhD [Caldilineaceae bacterium]
MARGRQAKRTIRTVEGERVARRRDYLAVEEPLEIQLRAGGERRVVAITMRTPGNDYELAAGFLHTEGIVADKRAIDHMIYCVDGESAQQEYNALAVALHAPALPELPGLDRHFFINSACGVCGRTMLDELSERPLPPMAPDMTVDADVITGLATTLAARQDIFSSTGGLHAAALFDRSGALLAVREDVGRHNALDKLIGWGVLQQQLPFHDKIILVSGRASYELLYKARVAGAPVFCAVSAPSSLAAELAARFDITLIGFLRDARFNIYSGEKRIAIAAKDR